MEALYALTEGFTWALVATFGGLVLGVLLLTEVFGWVVAKWGRGDPQPQDVRVSAAAFGVLLALAVVWMTPPVTGEAVVVGILNGLLAALIAMKGHELVGHGLNHYIEDGPAIKLE